MQAQSLKLSPCSSSSRLQKLLLIWRWMMLQLPLLPVQNLAACMLCRMQQQQQQQPAMLPLPLQLLLQEGVMLLAAHLPVDQRPPCCPLLLMSA